MLRPKRPEWQIAMRQAGSAVWAIPFAVSAALIVWKLSSWRLIIGSSVVLIAFAVSAVVFEIVFYSIFEWYWNRPDELAKRLPISSKELRRKTKQFCDSLPK